LQYYLEKNVLEAALDRIRWLYDEFEEVVVSTSGGKDSTVCFNLALQVAREKNRLPVNLMFIDQEAEWQATIDYQKYLMYREDVKPYWLQVYMKMFNSSNFHEGFRELWKPGEKWMREKDPISIKENVYGTERFGKLFNNFIYKEFDGKKACYIGGVRCEESPARRTALTHCEVYKGETWGANLTNNGVPVKHKNVKYTFYPIYDWSYRDIWAYIAKNKIPYNKIYDIQYSHGLSALKMRVSNLHHESAVHSLIDAGEYEPDTWNKIQEMVAGSNSIKQLPEAIHCPKELPYMFQDWREYRDFLVEKLVEPQFKEKFITRFKLMDATYEQYEHNNSVYRIQITAILTNDIYFTKLSNHLMHGDMREYRRTRRKELW
jgi:predicted phosphoadenosine phosphosulfate sulfurtransferase